MTDRDVWQLIDLAQELEEAQTTRNNTEAELGLAIEAYEQVNLTYINAKARLADIVQRVS